MGELFTKFGKNKKFRIESGGGNAVFDCHSVILFSIRSKQLSNFLSQRNQQLKKKSAFVFCRNEIVCKSPNFLCNKFDNSKHFEFQVQKKDRGLCN